MSLEYIADTEPPEQAKITQKQVRKAKNILSKFGCFSTPQNLLKTLSTIIKPGVQYPSVVTAAIEQRTEEFLKRKTWPFSEDNRKGQYPISRHRFYLEYAHLMSELEDYSKRQSEFFKGEYNLYPRSRTGEHPNQTKEFKQYSKIPT